MKCPNDPNEMCMSLFCTSTREPVSVKMADWQSNIQWILLDDSFQWSQQPLFSPRRHRDERTLHTLTKSKNQDLWHFSRLSMSRNSTKLWLKERSKRGSKRTRQTINGESKISHDIYDRLDQEDSSLISTITDDKQQLLIIQDEPKNLRTWSCDSADQDKSFATLFWGRSR